MSDEIVNENDEEFNKKRRWTNRRKNKREATEDVDELLNEIEYNKRRQLQEVSVGMVMSNESVPLGKATTENSINLLNQQVDIYYLFWFIFILYI